jgi:hypothetical protein
MARPSKQHEIGIWLKGLLSAGRRKAEDVIIAAVAAGYATNRGDGTRTLRRVKTALGIISEQDGEVWYWRDPAVAQSKAASNDKLDVLTHKVDELTRLSKPAVPVTPRGVNPDSTELLTSKKSKPYDPNDLEEKAIVAQANAVIARAKVVEHVVTSTDPFKLLDSANEDEMDRMMLLVHEHLDELETRGKGKPKFKKAWEVTKQVEKQVTGREWSTKQGTWVEVPAVQIEEIKSISEIPIDGAKPIDVPDGFEPDDSVTTEIGKWETWIDRAKERQSEFWKSNSVTTEA